MLALLDTFIVGTDILEAGMEVEMANERCRIGRGRLLRDIRRCCGKRVAATSETMTMMKACLCIYHQSLMAIIDGRRITSTKVVEARRREAGQVLS
jgi:hypothetical protein